MDNIRKRIESYCNINIRSIRNKMEFLETSLNDFDILVVTETHLDNQINDSDITLDSFRANILGVFRVKNHDFTPKNHIFSNFRGRAPGAPSWIRPCFTTLQNCQNSHTPDQKKLHYLSLFVSRIF
jgi:hypothetical protein